MRGTTVRDAKSRPMAGPYAGAIGLCGLLGCFVFGIACAFGLSDLSNQDAARGIKGALDQGAAVAVAKLGRISQQPESKKFPCHPLSMKQPRGYVCLGRARMQTNWSRR